MAKEGARKNKKLLILVICAVVVVAAAAAAIVLIGQHQAVQAELDRIENERLSIINSSVFHEGITIDGVDVTGLTIEEAKPYVVAAEEDMLDAVQLSLIYEDHIYTLTKDDFTAVFNTDQVLQEAFGLAREGDYETLIAELEDIKTNGRAFTTEFTLTADGMQAKIAQICTELETPPVNATVALNPDAASAEERFTYTEAVTGVAVDETALVGAIETAVSQGEYTATIQIPVVETQPEITTEELQQTLVLRGSAYTSYAKSPYNDSDRVFNIKKSVSLFSGTVVKPGETFSMNDTIGPRTYDRGWKPGGALVGGKTEKQAGGGVCQTSSTLYCAVVKADLEIVFRRAHSEKLGYIPGGLDATINTGTIDFKWRNNTNSDIIVFAYTQDSDKTIHVEIYGEPFATDEYDEIRLSSKRTGTVNPSGEMKYTVDKSKPADYKETVVKRKSGSTWVSYKHYYKDGVEVRVEKLADTTYRAYNGEMIVGTDPNASPSPSVSPSTKPSTDPTPSSSTEQPTTPASTEPTTPASTEPGDAPEA